MLDLSFKCKGNGGLLRLKRASNITFRKVPPLEYEPIKGLTSLLSLSYTSHLFESAGVVKLADTHGSGPCAHNWAWRFKSSLRHQKRQTRCYPTAGFFCFYAFYCYLYGDGQLGWRCLL